MRKSAAGLTSFFASVADIKRTVVLVDEISCVVVTGVVDGTVLQGFTRGSASSFETDSGQRRKAYVVVVEVEIVLQRHKTLKTIHLLLPSHSRRRGHRRRPARANVLAAIPTLAFTPPHHTDTYVEVVEIVLNVVNSVTSTVTKRVSVTASAQGLSFWPRQIDGGALTAVGSVYYDGRSNRLHLSNREESEYLAADRGRDDS